MTEYVVVYERGRLGEETWGAYVPDLPGCATTGDTLAEVKRHMREAIELHLEGLRAEGMPVPEPAAVAERLAVAA